MTTKNTKATKKAINYLKPIALRLRANAKQAHIKIMINKELETKKLKSEALLIDHLALTASTVEHAINELIANGYYTSTKDALNRIKRASTKDAHTVKRDCKRLVQLNMIQAQAQAQAQA